MTLNTLEKLWDQYQKLPAPDMSNDKGDLEEAVFDLMTADTLIAGIVETLVEGNSINESHQKILKMPLLNDKAFILSSGKEINLETVPEALNYVETLEQLRIMALSYL